MILIKKNESTTTLRRVPVIIVDQSDGNTLETGQTNFNIEVSKAGAAQASGTGVWGEIGDGEYYYQFGTTEVNTFGFLIARFNKTGMREFKAVAQIVGFNPYQTISTQSSVNAVPTQTEINVSVWGALPANVAVQTDINNLNDPTPSEINAVIETAHGAGAYGNNPTASSINAVIETAHGAGSYSGTSSTVINSIVNAQGLEVQSLINALNDPTSSAINAVITTAHGSGSYVGGGGQTTYNAVMVNQSILNQNQSLINNLDADIIALNDPTPSVINAVITTAHGAGSYVGAGASQTILNEHNATQSMINALNNVTSSAVNAVITTAHGAGSYVGAGASQTILNEHNATQSMINALNDLSTSQVQSIINTEGLEVQSLINALNDISTAQVQSIVNGLDDITVSQVQSIVNAQGLETQSLINALNDLSISQVQSIVNAQGLEVQSLINAMDVKIIRIEGRGGQYLVGKYTYNTSNINNKIEYWQYGSQTDMNNHQTINNINKWQLDVTLAGQLANIIKAGDHA